MGLLRHTESPEVPNWHTVRMATSDPKADLHRYLQIARDALLWKLDGLSDYDVRRPMVPTGTNLLGLVKHVASVELGYFGETFGRPFDEPLPWLDDDAEPNADMWATADQHRILTHIIAETNRHAGHADIVRELIDGMAGFRPHSDNMPRRRYRGMDGVCRTGD